MICRWASRTCYNSCRYVLKLRRRESCCSPSSIIRHTPYPLSTALTITLCTWSRALSMLWPLLSADCRGSIKLFVIMWSSSLVTTTFSIILERNERLDIGRKLLRTSWFRLAFLSRGWTMADFKSIETQDAFEDFSMTEAILESIASLKD